MRELKTDPEEFGRVTRELEQGISEYLAKCERQN